MSHSIDRVVTASQAVVSRHGSDVYSVDALPRPLSVAGVINIASTGWRRGLDTTGQSWTTGYISQNNSFTWPAHTMVTLNDQ